MSEGAPEAPVVIYIAGWGRSGSTLLSRLLDALPGTFATGELRSLWNHGVLEGRPCSCGHPIDECPVWSKVITDAGITRERAEAVRRLQLGRMRTRHFPVLAARALAHRPSADLQAFARDYHEVYRDVAAVTGASHLVDSSKHPFEGQVLATSGDVRVIHLVRDPRAVSFSWGRKKATGERPDEHMKQFGPFRSALMWTMWNSAIEAFFPRDRRLRLRYEDLVEDPAGSLQEVARFAGLPDDADTVAGALAARGGGHMLAGNPDRLAAEVRPVKLDDEWRRSMGVGSRIAATVPALPLLHRYDYPVVAGRAGTGGRGADAGSITP